MWVRSDNGGTREMRRIKLHQVILFRQVSCVSCVSCIKTLEIVFPLEDKVKAIANSQFINCHLVQEGVQTD